MVFQAIAQQLATRMTGSISRDDDRMMFRLLVPTVAWRKVNSAGVLGILVVAGDEQPARGDRP